MFESLVETKLKSKVVFIELIYDDDDKNYL